MAAASLLAVLGTAHHDVYSFGRARVICCHGARRSRETWLIRDEFPANLNSSYGPERPEMAADIANLGMLMNHAGQPAAGIALLRQALSIHEKTLGLTAMRRDL